MLFFSPGLGEVVTVPERETRHLTVTRLKRNGEGIAGSVELVSPVLRSLSPLSSVSWDVVRTPSPRARSPEPVSSLTEGISARIHRRPLFPRSRNIESL